jgi:DNA polymerase/3'-5' exonuclease PolX
MTWSILQRFRRRHDPVDPEITLIMDELDAWLSREHELLDNVGLGVGDVGSVLRSFAQRCQKVALVGSCRRGKANPGDVDVLYVPKNNLQVIEFLEQIADNERDIKRIGQAWTCIVGGRRVDFIESAANTWGLDTVVFTGSRDFNERVVRHASRRGYEIENGRPVVRRDGEYTSYIAPAFCGWSEEKILTHLGLGDFLDPRTRSNNGGFG